MDTLVRNFSSDAESDIQEARWADEVALDLIYECPGEPPEVIRLVETSRISSLNL
jgi:hypothetical protein